MSAALVLAHHPVVEALPAVVPAFVLTGAFAFIVWSDRRRVRRERQDLAASQAIMDGCPPSRPRT